MEKNYTNKNGITRTIYSHHFRNTDSLDNYVQFMMNEPYWFSKSTMRFFRTRVLESTITTDLKNDRVLFVTSECGPSGVRAYSLRCMCLIKGTIDTLGDFNKLTKYQATKALKSALTA